ncbi:hypothetical protein [Nocardioides sp. LHD-245]
MRSYSVGTASVLPSSTAASTSRLSPSAKVFQAGSMPIGTS